MPPLNAVLTGSGWVVDPIIGPLGNLQDYAWASKPSPVGNKGAINATDIGGGAVFVSNGLRYKPLNGECILDSVDTANPGIAQTAIQNLNPNHRLIPAGVIQGNDRLVIAGKLNSTGTTDSANLIITLGTAGLTGDTQLLSIPMAAGSRQLEFEVKIKRIDATNVRVESIAAPGGIAAESTVAAAANVLVQNLDTLAQYIGLCVTQSGAVDTPTISDYTAHLKSTDT